MAIKKKDILALQKVIANPKTNPEQKERFQKILDKMMEDEGMAVTKIEDEPTALADSPESKPEKPKRSHKKKIKGNIIGHTKSNKSVYSDVPPDEYSKGFTIQDHKDAALIHYESKEKRIENEGEIARKDADRKVGYHDDKSKGAQKTATPTCDELIDKFKAAKKARLERQKARKDDTRKPDTRLRDEADKKMTDIINKIMKLSKKDQLSKRVKKDVLDILKEGVSHISKV